MKNEYLMLAQTYKDQFVGHWYISEKLDGCRAFWDGGISRGEMASDVPYANCIKDYRLKAPPIATGLWSRSGKVIQAPDWWLDQLPRFPLDGELYLKLKCFQKLRTIIGKADGDWSKVTYYVFDSPSWHAFGRPRDIKIRNEYSFSVNDVFLWIQNRVSSIQISPNLPFDCILEYLDSRCHDCCKPLKQIKLPGKYYGEVIDKKLNSIVAKGGEGVMLRKPSCVWTPERSHDLLKYKPSNDAEGIVTGFTLSLIHISEPTRPY